MTFVHRLSSVLELQECILNFTTCVLFCAVGSMRTISWGIVGVGDVCEKKSGPAFYKAEGSKLVAVMRRNAAAAEDYAKRHNVPKWYSNVDDLLNDSAVSAVYVASPPGTHLEIALKVAAAGKPCYLEKPMARNAAESKEIIDAFASTNIPLYVAYYRRGQTRFIKARELVHQGAIGRVTDVVYRFQQNNDKLRASTTQPWRVQAHVAGGGLFMDVGCHALDIMDYILGPLSSVTGRASDTGAYGVEEVVSMTALAESQDGLVPLTATWNFAAAVTEPDVIKITGTKGILRITALDINHPVELELAGEKEVQKFDFPSLEHVQQPLIEVGGSMHFSAYCLPHKFVITISILLHAVG